MSYTYKLVKPLLPETESSIILRSDNLYITFAEDKRD